MSHTPPALRSPQGYQLATQAVAGKLVLQRCASCQTVNYPPRERCVHCLGDELNWTTVSGGGELLACSELQHSLEAYFQDQMPWTLASVRLDCGAVVLAWLNKQCTQGNTRVEVSHYLQSGDGSILRASPVNLELS